VSRAAERVREAAALGFGRVALPARDASNKLKLPATAIRTVADLPSLLAAHE
jgi:predicted ATP-dependent serine protease